MVRQALANSFGRLLWPHLTHYQGVEANHLCTIEGHVGAAGVGALIHPCEANQETIQPFLTTIEAIQAMAGLQQLNP
jgi:hypothetical protein